MASNFNHVTNLICFDDVSYQVMWIDVFSCARTPKLSCSWLQVGGRPGSGRYRRSLGRSTWCAALGTSAVLGWGSEPGQAREFTVDRFFSFTKFQLTYATVIATVEVVVGGSVKGPGSVNWKSVQILVFRAQIESRKWACLIFLICLQRTALISILREVLKSMALDFGICWFQFREHLGTGGSWFEAMFQSPWLWSDSPCSKLQSHSLDNRNFEKRTERYYAVASSLGYFG